MWDYESQHHCQTGSSRKPVNQWPELANWVTFAMFWRIRWSMKIRWSIVEAWICICKWLEIVKESLCVHPVGHMSKTESSVYQVLSMLIEAALDRLNNLSASLEASDFESIRQEVEKGICSMGSPQLADVLLADVLVANNFSDLQVFPNSSPSHFAILTFLITYRCCFYVWGFYNENLLEDLLSRHGTISWFVFSFHLSLVWISTHETTKNPT